MNDRNVQQHCIVLFAYYKGTGQKLELNYRGCASLCGCTYSIKLLSKLQCQCPSGEAIDDWQRWTDKFLLDPIVVLFVCCSMMLSVAKAIEHM
jgi:hypothetical protein